MGKSKYLVLLGLLLVSCTSLNKANPSNESYVLYESGNNKDNYYYYFYIDYEDSGKLIVSRRESNTEKDFLTYKSFNLGSYECYYKYSEYGNKEYVYDYGEYALWIKQGK